MTDRGRLRGLGTRLRPLGKRAARARTCAYRVAFGDEIGLLLFLLALFVSALTWRIGFFITDNWTLANAFVAVADGNLHVEAIRYGPDHGMTPGMKAADGRLYGRNYGQLFASLPFLWLLWGVSAVAEPAVAIVVAFGLLVLALFVQLGRVLDREVTFSYAGVVLALATVAMNLAVAVEIRAYWLPVAALQLATMVAAALTAVVVYRLLDRTYGNPTAVAAGAAVALASPVPFWATIPKRHALTALAVVVTLYCLYRSREDPGTVWPHALAYVTVGLLAWVHAAEALAVLLALLVADLATLPRANVRRVTTVAGAFLASLLPFLLTNWLIAGDVLTTPRMLSDYFGNTGIAIVAGDSWALAFARPTSGPLLLAGKAVTATPTPKGSGQGTGPLVDWLVALAAVAAARVELYFSYVARSLAVAFDADRMVAIFVRSGYVERAAHRDGQVAVSLSVLESMPLLGALLAVPVAVGRRAAAAIPVRFGDTSRGLVALGSLRSGGGIRRLATPGSIRPGGRLRGLIAPDSLRNGPSARKDPTVAADAFVGCVALSLLALFLWRLPVYGSWTVRYLHPLYPLGVYALARVPAVRETVQRDPWLVAASYAGTVFIGGQVFVLALAALDPTLGEAVQLHARVAVAAGSLAGAWAVVSAGVGDLLRGPTRRHLRRSGGVLLAVCCGVTTVLVVLWAVAYYPHSQFALPAVEELARAFPFPS